VALDSSTPTICANMHTNVLVKMLSTHKHVQLNDLLGVVLSDLNGMFDKKDFHDPVLKQMLAVVDVLKSSNDIMVKRAFLLASLTLSTALQQHVYKESTDCVHVEVAFKCNRVLEKYTRLYLDFAIDEKRFVAKVLQSQCVA
jgi:hypothetical protein